MEQKKFPDGHTVTDFLTLLNRSEKSERAFTFAHCKVSETYLYSFNTNIGNYCRIQQILLDTSVNVVLMTDDGPQGRNVTFADEANKIWWLTLTGL